MQRFLAFLPEDGAERCVGPVVLDEASPNSLRSVRTSVLLFLRRISPSWSRCLWSSPGCFKISSIFQRQVLTRVNENPRKSGEHINQRGMYRAHAPPPGALEITWLGGPRRKCGKAALPSRWAKIGPNHRSADGAFNSSRANFARFSGRTRRWRTLPGATHTNQRFTSTPSSIHTYRTSCRSHS